MRERILYVILLVPFLFVYSSVLYARDLPEILSSGYINVATRDIGTPIYQSKDKDSPGFCYELAKTFSKSIGVSLELYIVEKFADYWMKDGKLLLKKRFYLKTTPDIYKKVDMVADIITVTKRREELVNMIPFIENTELFFARKGLNIRNYEGLKGHRIFTFEGSSFFSLLKNILKKRGIPYVINYVAPTKDGKKLNYIDDKRFIKDDEVEILLIPFNIPVSVFMSYYEVLLGNADVGIQDSFVFFLHYLDIDIFRNYLRPLFPMRNKVGYLSFCVPHDSPKLTDRLRNFMDYYKNSVFFSNLVKKYMGISYSEYKNLLNSEGK